MATKDLFDVHGRLFNHRPFLQGEIRHFVKEFEEKRGDREVENVFKILEKVTELRDCEVDKVKAECDSIVPQVNANLLVANSMYNKILDQARTSEIEQALDSSRHARDKEWSNFIQDIQNKCEKIDDAYRKKEQDLRLHYIKLDEMMKEEQ